MPWNGRKVWKNPKLWADIASQRTQIPRNQGLSADCLVDWYCRYWALWVALAEQGASEVGAGRPGSQCPLEQTWHQDAVPLVPGYKMQLRA